MLPAVPRDQSGNFLPPQYRFDSVPASAIQVGDLVNWNHEGVARVCKVVDASQMRSGAVHLFIEWPGVDFGKLVVLDPDTTVNRVEVLW